MLAFSAHTSEFVAAYFNERVANLHHSISLREDDGTAALASFIEHYVELAPDFITPLKISCPPLISAVRLISRLRQRASSLMCRLRSSL